MNGTARRLAAWSPILLLGGCQGVLNPAGPVGRDEKTILLDSLAIMLVIIVPTILATLAFAWWFRAGNTRARYRPDWAFSGRIEVMVWSIPLLTITLLGGVAWVGAHTLDPGVPLQSSGRAPAAETEIEVVALDWKWLFIYPHEHVASVNELVVPAGQPVHFFLTSGSVLNAFFVPRLGSMIYVMNGMTTQLHLQADKPGEYPGLSSHFSGDGFSDMHFLVRAVSPPQYRDWVAAARRSKPRLDEVAYGQLTHQSMKVAPFTYAAADPALFGRIVSQELPPAPGPKPAAATPGKTPTMEPER